MFGKAIVRGLLAAAVCVFLVSAASADVFDMGPGLTSLETVPIGNVGNPADPKTGAGTVEYEYNIGKYEVTAGQYTEFLNAVGGQDPYGLYNSDMWFNSTGCKIERSGSGTNEDPYTYDVASTWANRPVNYVSWGSAARFTNWLHNRQPTGAQDLTTTEDGAYFLNGATEWSDFDDLPREADWQWAIPTGPEWYKAAYYDQTAASGNYFDYPTSSNAIPSHELVDPDPGNNANFKGGTDVYTIGAPFWRTEVGDFENSSSPCGTFDQGGNVWEWIEATGDVWDPVEGEFKQMRFLSGGSYVDVYGVLNSTPTYFCLGAPVYAWAERGFRVVQVPEPASMTLLGAGVLALLAYAWRRRRS